ncbi:MULTISPECIES: ABC transporter permease [Bacillaceae]|uniref:ABC transporter permease n=1 Tax=Bacillaceae TaxID=186817 RepID=UPI00118AAA81|nr:ABC transporter permease subunit [Bacillus sp. S3]QCJ40716.1 ABC transporter permease subunit [Bacillus sp. S3]
MRKYKMTIAGSMIILGILISSCLYPFYGPADYEKEIFKYDGKGGLIGRAPFPPSLHHIFGTNPNGEDMFLIVLDGAKYTIITAFIVTFLRLLLGVVIGILLSFSHPNIKTYFKDLFIGFRYIPSIIIALLLMTPVTVQYTGIGIWSIITYQIFILGIVAFPAVVLTTADMVDELKKQTFIKSSYLMGATHLHIVRKHLFPYVRSYGLLMGVQQYMNTLVLMMHLGIFSVFIGGPQIGGINDGSDYPPLASLSNEWSGLIGQNFRFLLHYPWVELFPVFGFFFLIIIMNVMKRELTASFQDFQIASFSKRKRSKQGDIQKRRG